MRDERLSAVCCRCELPLAAGREPCFGGCGAELCVACAAAWGHCGTPICEQVAKRHSGAEGEQP